MLYGIQCSTCTIEEETHNKRISYLTQLLAATKLQEVGNDTFSSFINRSDMFCLQLATDHVSYIHLDA